MGQRHVMKATFQRGAQIVEFAFVLPFLLIILFLIIDLGFLVYNKAVITNASREAARSGAMLKATPWSTAAVAAVACAYARNALITTGAGTRAADCSGTADPVIVVLNPNGNVPPRFDDPISVRITYRFSGFLLNRTVFSMNASMLDLSAASTMRHE